MGLRYGTLVWSAVALVTVLRAIFAATLPLSGDEAYYWEWSRRLAAGYVDHPPAVAFAIAAFGWLGRSPFAVRIAFVLCGLLTALFVAGAASRLARDARAGLIAALAVSLSPMLVIAFGIATPDGPFALAWSASLYCAVRAFEDRGFKWFGLLGVAMGAALLSRFFAVALVAGIAAAALAQPVRALRARTFLAIAIAVLLWLPYLVWNANHHWISFTFALIQRHHLELDGLRPLELYGLAALGFSPGFWIAATLMSWRTRNPIVFWTALPFGFVLFILAFREQVEVYWLIGPFLSLCVSLGCAYASWSAPKRSRANWYMVLPAAFLCAVLFAAGIAPSPLYAAARHAGLRLHNGGPFEIFTYPPLARDVAREAGSRHAVVMTDGYGFSSLLDFYAGMYPVLIGYAPQGEEARNWFSEKNDPRDGLFVDKEPFASRPDFVRQFHLACSRVKPGVILRYPLAFGDPNIPPRRYFLTWCLGMKPGAIRILRWRDQTST